MRRLLKGLSVSLIGLLLLLGAIEALFICGHALYEIRLEGSLRESKIGLNGSILPVVTIATIGESTTAPWLVNGEDISWPRQLESQINKSPLGLKYYFSVINVGQTSVPSALVVKNLEEQIDLIRPDIVISMMGINDFISLHLDESFLYRNSYIYRFLYWAMVALRCPKCHQVEYAQAANTAQPLNEFELMARAAAEELAPPLGKIPIKSGELEEYMQRTETALKRSSLFKAELSVEVASQVILLLEKFRSESPKFEERVLKSNNFRKFLLNVIMALNDAYLRVRKADAVLTKICLLRRRLQMDCIDDLLQAFAKGIKPTPQLLTGVMQGEIEKRPEVLDLLRREGLKIEFNSEPYLATISAYKNLGRLLKNRRIQWFAMQYPTGSVGALKRILSNSTLSHGTTFCSSFYTELDTQISPEFDGTYFISNANFNSAVENHNPSEYFLDFFARNCGLNFGHTTKKGSELIAKNVIDALEKNWSSIESQIRLSTSRQ